MLSMALVMMPRETFASDPVPNPDVTYDAYNNWEGTLIVDENKTIKLASLEHDNEGSQYASAIKISNGATVNIVIEGEVTLKGNSVLSNTGHISSDTSAAGIEVEEGSTVNLYGLEGSKLTIVGGRYGAGIGGIGYENLSESNPCAGKVNIYSGEIFATGGDRGAGIGAGRHSSASEINIFGGNIYATGGTGGAGIGSGYGTSGGSSGFSSGPQVGFYHGGNISISGGTIQATGGIFAAGIGGGYGASSGNITIEGDAMVTATGSVGGAGIGTGRGTPKLANYDSNNSNLSVSIKGNATVIANATKDDRANQHLAGGAGIGLGRGFNDCGSITIEENASVSASAESFAAAIGGGVIVKSIRDSDSLNSEDFAKPTITIASTTKITSSNDGSVPAVNGSNMHSMSHEVTFKVTNGFWKDETSDDITVTAEGYEGEGYSVNLRDEQIPDVGDNPSDGFRTGDWDTKPSVDTELTGDTTYTYSYVAKANPKVTPPAAKTGLVFNGSAQALVTAGSTDGGTMMYALGANATTKPAESAYTASIPANTKAGTYYVWYMVKGDDNYFGTEPKCITVTIAEPEKDESSDSNDKDTPAGVDTDEVNPGIDEDSTDPDSSKDDKEQADPSDNNDDVDPTSNSDSQKKIKDNFSNEWVDGKWYSSDGSQTYEPRGRWEQDGKGWYYIDESGWYPESMWQKIDSDWYYFDEEGYMATNQYCGSWDTYTKGFWWVGTDGCWDGSACAIWHITDGEWWFGDSDGWYAHNGWLMINRKWYYFDSDGWMLSNRWIGSWYVGEDGALEE